MTSIKTPGRVPNFFLYGEPPPKVVDRTLHVETIEFRSAPHHWKIDPHVHRSLHQLVFVLRGRGVALAESHSAEFLPPALIVVPASTVHGFVFEPGTQGFVLSITDDLRREITRREPLMHRLFESPATVEVRGGALRATDLKQSFAMLLREFARSARGHTLALEGLLKVILANVLRLVCTLAESGDSPMGRHRELVSRFRELIERDFRKLRSVTEYSEALNVSESRLRSSCLSMSGQSPMQIMHARVLVEAKRDLVYTSASVSEIAYALGFDDPSYFTRFFSRRTGASPRAFRARFPRVR